MNKITAGFFAIAFRDECNYWVIKYLGLSDQVGKVINDYKNGKCHLAEHFIKKGKKVKFFRFNYYDILDKILKTPKIVVIDGMKLIKLPGFGIIWDLKLP